MIIETIGLNSSTLSIRPIKNPQEKAPEDFFDILVLYNLECKTEVGGKTVDVFILRIDIRLAFYGICTPKMVEAITNADVHSASVVQTEVKTKLYSAKYRSLIEVG